MKLLGYKITTTLDDIASLVTRHPSPVVINTLNPHSYILAKKDELFREALQSSDILLPDGIGIVWAARILNHKKIKKIAGADLHEFLLEKLNETGGACFYLGASQHTLDLIRQRVAREYPNVRAGFYSPPFTPLFTEEDNLIMVEQVNNFFSSCTAKPATDKCQVPGANLQLTTDNRQPTTYNRQPTTYNQQPTTDNQQPTTDNLQPTTVLFIGMTAPKQEKWAFTHKEQLNAGMICSIGAVFDFFAGTVTRSSPFWINLGLEWLPRLVREPRRLYKRIFVSGPLFMYDVIKTKLHSIC